MHCLNDADYPPPWDAGEHIWGRLNPRKELTELMHRASIIRFKFRQLGEENPRAVAWPFKVPADIMDGVDEDSLLQEALELDSRLEGWWTNLAPNGYLPQAEIHPQNRPPWARDLFSLPGAPTHMTLFKSALSALGSDLYRATRLFLNLSVLRCARRMANSSTPLNKMSLYYESLVNTTASLMVKLVDGICMSIPCLLQMTATGGPNDPSTPDEIYGFRAMLILWPLISVQWCLEEEEVQRYDLNLRRVWIPCVLVFLRNSMCLAKAAAYLPAPRDPNVPVESVESRSKCV